MSAETIRSLASTPLKMSTPLLRAVSTRMLAGMWWFFVLILNASYTANLAAFLTTGRIEETITSVQELADQTKVKYGVMEGGATAGFFSKSDNPLYQRIWVQMAQAKPSVFVKSNDEGVARVRKERGRFAYFMESSSIGYQMHKYCDLMQVGMELDSKSYGIALPLNSPYRSLINKAILELQESGNLSKIKTKWWEKAGGDCFKFLSGDSQDLEIQGISSSFINLAFVNGMSPLQWVQNRALYVHLEATYGNVIVALVVYHYLLRPTPVAGSTGDPAESKVEVDSNELGISNVAGVFWVVIIGTGTAFFVASCELLWNCRKIAVEEKVTPWKAIVAELKFALNFSNQTKPVNLSHGGSESESSEDSFESNDAENQLEN
uniref:Ionotropic glutamate receptor C-terminal domain-containing protein n=1 Tax=Timema bartmani TaxID=61472 RepID=A0A7R9EZD0_9NEOP|nr:unnamed protein product [Timema bartmani]